MPEYLFHYTSREHAQSIAAAGILEARARGMIYLTPDVYERGSQAVDALAVGGKPLDVVGLIPRSLLKASLPVRVAGPLYHPVTGMLVRRGGGAEICVSGPLTASGIRWLALSPP